MPRFDIHDAVQLSELINMVNRGDEVFITENNKCVAKLVGLSQSKGTIKFGSMKGKIWIADDFDGPLPDDIQAAFEGR